MTAVINRYTIQDFETIKDEGFNIELPEKTISIINTIAEQVGSQGYIKTPYFRKSKKKPKQPIDPAVLENMNFVSYENKNPDEEVVTIETLSKDIHVLLNKITPSNYDKLFEKMSTNMKNIIDMTEDNNEEPFNEICNFIFNYATSNKVGVPVYAKLYVNLMKTFPVLNIIFEKKFSNYITMFNKIEQNNGSIDDYNYFCKISQINMKRRVFSLFIIELYKFGIVKLDNIVSIIISLQSDLVYSINWNNEGTKCEEIGENIHIFISKLCSNLMKHPSWNTIKENIHIVKETSVQDVISMTNKIKFKHMDIEDVIKKASIYKPPIDKSL
jgi:hypothetical protein